MLNGIIEDTNSKTRPPVKSVYDLAMLITGRCIGVFDRHSVLDAEYQFLDMFESSLGEVVCGCSPPYFGSPNQAPGGYRDYTLQKIR